MKKLMLAILVLISVGFAMAQCGTVQCESDEVCTGMSCGNCVGGYCTNVTEAVPEFGAVGIITLIAVAAIAGFFMIRKK